MIVEQIDTNNDGVYDALSVKEAGTEGQDGIYHQGDEIPRWLFPYLPDVFRQNGDKWRLEGRPEVPSEMPPPPPQDHYHNELPNTLPKDAWGGNGPVKVNTEALRMFSNYLDLLSDPLKTLKTDIDQVSVRAGAFYQAFHLENAIHGDASLQHNTSKMISQTLDAFALIKRAITKLTAEYDTVEELNSAGAEDLNKLIGDAKNLINKMSS
jgi:hypothetical protein